MLGVRRNCVSVVTGTLQEAGLIRYVRGNIEITNRIRLAQCACECYGTVKGHYEKLLLAD
jgi:hypothetical protein